MKWTQDLDKMVVLKAGTVHQRVLHCSQVEGLEIFGEKDLRHELHSGLTDGIQEVVGQETSSPQGQ